MSETESGRISYIRERLSGTGIEASEQQASDLLKYYKLLVEKNKVMNLTAITDFEEAVEKHFADSLALLKFFDLKLYESLLDVGSGAGMPGIPLKIMNPELKVVLLDAVGKKTTFQTEVGDTLKFKSFKPIHARSEDAAHDLQYREQFDIVTARAVANLATLSEYCIPFVKKGGYFIAYKSDLVEEELNSAEKAIKLLGGRIDRTERYAIGENGRSLIFIKKIKSTPGRYPRKAGTPSKQPIL